MKKASATVLMTWLAMSSSWLATPLAIAQPTSTPAPTKPVGPLNYSFRFPFVGEIKCQARTETVEFKDADGKVQTLTLTCCYSQDGTFLRAEYAKEGAPVFEYPLEEMERLYQGGQERIVAIPGIKTPVDLTHMINQLSLTHGLKGLTRLNITNAIWKQSDFEPKAILIVNVWGPENDFFPLQHDPRARKARYFIDATGKFLQQDNLI